VPIARTARRLGAAAALVGLASLLTACDDPPTVVNTSVGFNCEIKSNNILVPNTTGTLSSTYTTTGPQAAAPGGTLTIKVTPEPFTLSSGSSSDGTVQNLTNLVWRVAIPAGTTLASHAITGWANVGAGTPTSAVSGNAVVVTVPGPIAANTTATLPTVTMNLQVTGAAGTNIDAKIAGTSYGSPGFSFNLRVTGTVVGTLNPTFNCYPSPSPVLHRTLISTDTKAPVITITSPVAAASIVQGTTGVADFSCDDGTGVGVATCSGTVADGAAISTATLGTKTFTVTSTDLEGKASSKSVTYTVVAPG
jgi:dehydratase